MLFQKPSRIDPTGKGFPRRIEILTILEMKKRIVLVLVLLVGLLIAGVGLLWWKLDAVVKAGVETAGPMITGVEVKLDEARVSPLSGSGHLRGFVLGNPDGYTSPSALQASDIRVKLRPSSVFSDVVVIDLVEIRAPEVTFEGNLAGNNLKDILKNVQGEAEREEAQSEEEKAGEMKFIIGELIVADARIHASLKGLGAAKVSVGLPDFHERDIGKAEGGVTATELVAKIMKPFVASVAKAAGDGLKNAGVKVGDLGEGGIEQVGEAAKGIKSLFQKKKDNE